MASTIVGAYPCARAYADTYARPIHGVASLLTGRAVETIGPRTSATRGVEARGVKPVSITAVLLTRRRGPNWSSNGGLCEENPPVRALCGMGEPEGNVRTAVDEPPGFEAWRASRGAIERRRRTND